MNRRIIAAILLAICGGQAKADINIIPLATANVRVDLDYHRQMLRTIRGILQATGIPDCINATVGYALPRSVPSSESPIGLVSRNTDLNELIDWTTDQGGNVLMVAALSACGRYENEASVAGCSSPNTAAVVEMSGDPRRDARALLHEILHSFNVLWSFGPEEERYSYPNPLTGAPTRDPAHAKSSSRLMFYALGGEGLTAEECRIFARSNALFRRPLQPGAVLTDGVEEASNDEVASQTGPYAELYALLALEWRHGVPKAELNVLLLEEGAIQEVRSVLVRDDLFHSWSNALKTLAWYGDVSDLLLIDYFKQRPLEVPEGSERFRTNALGDASWAHGFLSAKLELAQGLASAAAVVDNVAETIAADRPLSEVTAVNLDGLPQGEQQLAAALVVENALLTQQYALARFPQEQIAAAVDLSDGFGNFLAQSRGEQIIGGGARNAALASLGISRELIVGDASEAAIERFGDAAEAQSLDERLLSPN